MEKPPTGVTPYYIFIEGRIKEISEAIERYLEAKQEIPIEWVNELNEYYSFLARREADLIGNRKPQYSGVLSSKSVITLSGAEKAKYIEKDMRFPPIKFVDDLDFPKVGTMTPEEVEKMNLLKPMKIPAVSEQVYYSISNDWAIISKKDNIELAKPMPEKHKNELIEAIKKLEMWLNDENVQIIGTSNDNPTGFLNFDSVEAVGKPKDMQEIINEYRDSIFLIDGVRFIRKNVNDCLKNFQMTDDVRAQIENIDYHAKKAIEIIDKTK